MEAGAGGDDGGGIIPLGEQHQWMVSAAEQQRAIDQRGELLQDGFEKAADQILDKQWNVRQIGRATA